jgi:L-lactate dehydrogenase complex protein LldE
MVKQQYPLLFEDEPEWLQRTEELSQRIFELTEYLVDVLKVEDVGASYSGKVAYHESCHINRCLNISEQPKKLINAVNGAEPVPLDQADVCCGFGGEFSGRYPEISEAMVSEKVENYINSKADLLLLCEPGCLLNIGGFLSRHNPDKKVLHMANFLNG